MRARARVRVRMNTPETGCRVNLGGYGVVISAGVSPGVTGSGKEDRRSRGGGECLLFPRVERGALSRAAPRRSPGTSLGRAARAAPVAFGNDRSPRPSSIHFPR